MFLNDDELFNDEMDWSKESFEKMRCDSNGENTTTTIDLHDIDGSSMTVINELFEEVIESVATEDGVSKIEIMDLSAKYDIENWLLECLAKKA